MAIAKSYLKRRLVLPRPKGVRKLPDFAYQAETSALVATFSAAPSTRRKKTMDKFFRTVKNFPAGDPVWAKVIGFGAYQADTNAAKANWKDLSKPCTVVGSITFADGSASGTGTVRSAYYLDDLPANDFECGIFVTGPGTANTSPDFGARDATNGVTMTVRSTAANTMAARCGGAVSTTIGNTTDWDGTGAHSVCRRSGTEFEAYKGVVKKATVSSTAATLAHQQIYVMGQNQNGSAVASTNTQFAWWITRALSAEQREVLVAAVTRLQQEITNGELDDYRPGFQPQNVSSYDYLVIGSGMGGCCAAINLKRYGKNVAVIGDDPDLRLGGETTGGLGYIDTYAFPNVRGIFKLLLRKCQTIEGKAFTATTVLPATMERVLRAMFDPTKTDGQDIPVYWTTGIKSVREDATGVTVTTRDGRVFRGKVWLDGGDENSAAQAANITHSRLREAPGTGYDAYNGVIAPVNEFSNHAGAAMSIDPFVTPGVQASGLIRGVDGYASDLVIGSASPKWQAFNVRMTLTKDPAIMVPFDSTPPAGWDPADVELLLRQLSLDPTLAFTDLFKVDVIMTTTFGFIYDVNNKNGFGTDYRGDASQRYINGDYATKQAVSKEIERHIRGIFYTLQYLNDARVPSALRTEALLYGMVATHYVDPDRSRGQRAFWPNRTYVREPPRMISDYIGVGQDAAGADGTTPRSTNTVSVFTYKLDSHASQNVAYYNGSSWEVRCEGGFFLASGGSNETTPLPYEAFLPKRSEAKRGLVCFGASVNHILNSGVRMEPTFALTGQALSCALMIAEETGVDVQDVPYADLRARILDTAYLFANETAPYLPQVN